MDLLGTVLHELAHGIFFTSNDDVDPSKTKGTFGHFMRGVEGFRPGSGWFDIAWTSNTGARFDDFLFVGSSGSDSLVSRCENEVAFHQAQTGNSLYFRDDSAALGTNFRLYAPWSYEFGSSVSHFADRNSILEDCTANGIDASNRQQCSELMTPQAGPGQYDHEIGENTMRVLRSMRSSAVGSSSTICKSNPVRPIQSTRITANIPKKDCEPTCFIYFFDGV